MATTYTGTCGVVKTDYWAANSPKVFSSNAITLPSNVSKANLTAYSGPAGDNAIGYLRNSDTMQTHTATFYISNSDGSIKISVGSASCAKSNIANINITKNNVDISSLAGQKLYGLIVYNSGGSNLRFYGKFKITITTLNIAVIAGNYIYATDRSQTGTATNAGATLSDSHFDSGDLAAASTFNSQVLGL